MRFDNPSDLARATRQQSSETKLSGIALMTLAIFHNWVDVLVFYCFRANVRHAFHSQSALVIFVIVVFMKSSCWLYKGSVKLQLEPLQHSIGKATAGVEKSLL